MKKYVYIVFAVVATLLSSCSKKVELTPVNIEPIVVENGDITFKIDPRNEVLMAAFRLAEISFAMNQGGNGEYLSGINRILESQKNHALVKQIKDLFKDYNGDINYILCIIDYISPDFTQINVDKKNLPEELKPFWEKADFTSFINNFNDFAEKSHYERLFKLYDKDLKSGINNLKEFYNKNNQVLPWIKDYFYDKNGQINFIITVSPMLDRYVISQKETVNGDKITIEYFSVPFVPQEQYVDINYSLAYSYKVFRDLLDENWNDVSDSIKKYVNKICVENKIDTKKFKDYNYISEAADYFAITTIENYLNLTKDEEITKDVMDSVKSNILFDKIDNYIGYLKYYEENRNTYPDMKTFFTEYLMEKIKEDL